MKLNSPKSVWRVKSCPPALVLVVESDETSIWDREARELVRKLKHRLPKVHIASANNRTPQGLQSALTAAWFRGASSAIVVNLWGLDSNSGNQTIVDQNDLPLEVNSSESPPDVESIAASYHAAWLAQTPSESFFLPCN